MGLSAGPQAGNPLARTTRQLALAALLAAAPLLAAAVPGDDAIEQAMQRTMDTFQVPGMTVAVVHGGEVHFTGGMGIRETARDARVTKDTLFQIASVSKAFTAAALAVLVDEGKLAWDAPVIDYLPDFRMYDPWVTREFTVRDLLTHRSGLPLGAGDLLLFPEGDTSRAEIVRAMRFLKPSSSFRSQYDYDNLLYVIAGVVVEQVSGMPFEAFVEQRLLQPAGMPQCVAGLDRADKRAAHATPHVLVDGELETTRSLITATSAPAGGIVCDAQGMARWMQLVINNGLGADGNRVISEAQFAQLVRPVTLVAPAAYMTEHAGTHLRAYALGWNVSSFHGELLLSHSGGLWGMTSFVAILPARGLGVFVSNNLMSAAPRAMAFDLLEMFMAGDNALAGQTDWTSIFGELVRQRQTTAGDTVAAAAAARDPNSTPSLPLQRYTGVYRDNWYGTIRISLDENGQLHFASDRSAALAGPLEHFQFNTFIARWNERKLNADAYVSFELSPQGEVQGITMQAVSPATDFSFDFHDLDLKREASDSD
jgi:CubicO group peptidase (beta-lactamase class C family)